MRQAINRISMFALCLILWSSGCASHSHPGTGDATVAAAAVGKAAPTFSLAGSDGKNHALSDYKGKVVVLEWVNYDCPFVKKHYGSGNMQALQKKFAAKDVVWLSINSSAPGKQGNFPAARVNELLKEKGAAPKAYLFDPEGKTGTAYGAKTTPHMFVIDAKGVLVYAGAIDDKPSTDREDIKSAKNYVEVALVEVLAGKPVTTGSTKSYGCSVKY